MGNREREKNSNWRGGRSITEHGYVLIRVGVKHHLADVRGYAYEHRLVAEKKIGRRLRKGEVAYHRDLNKRNNKPRNILVGTKLDAALLRRRGGKALRMPGERNPVIRCACGCGGRFRKFDDVRRGRRFITGHNLRRSNGS